MSHRNEAFAHFDICIDHLGSAWNTLTAIKEHSGHSLVGPAFRFALVEYSIPYTSSEGIAKSRHRLDTRFVPGHLLDLHNRVLLSRNKILAHADLSVLQPEISYSYVDGQRLVARIQNNVDGLEELPNIDSILELIAGTLDHMFVAREKLKLELDS